MDSDIQKSSTGFTKFLAFLSADEDEGARLYEDLRARLTRYFRLRGLNDCDEAADDALDRVMRKLEEGEEIKDYLRYSYGVARLVAIEKIKRRRAVSVDTDALVLSAPEDEPADEDARLDVLRTCLQKLDDQSRQLLLDYYDIGPRRLDLRETLAQKNNLNINSLRLRVFRMKKQLQTCVEENFFKKQ